MNLKTPTSLVGQNSELIEPQTVESFNLYLMSYIDVF